MVRKLRVEKGKRTEMTIPHSFGMKLLTVFCAGFLPLGCASTRDITTNAGAKTDFAVT